MNILLRRDSRRFNYQKHFGSTTQFSPTLLIDAGLLELQPLGNVQCTCYAVDNIATALSGKVYDHNWLWAKMSSLGKTTPSGASPQDAFSTGVKGLSVVPTGEIEKPAVAYFQCDEGEFDYFDNVKSCMQMEFNKGFKRPIGVATYWYAEWLYPDFNAVFPLGKTVVSSHEWMICGWDEQHPDCLKIDWWGGRYNYVPREVFNAAMHATYGSVALTLAQTDEEAIAYLKSVKVSLINKAIDLAYNILIALRAKFSKGL